MRREKEGENTLRKFGETIRRPSTLCSALQTFKKLFVLIKNNEKLTMFGDGED